MSVADFDILLVLYHPVQVEVYTGDEPQEIQHMLADDHHNIAVFLKVPFVDLSILAVVRPIFQFNNHGSSNPDELALSS
jgi:hypothetical protein